jgi:hypothetical protein
MRLLSALASVFAALLVLGAPLTGSAAVVATCTDPSGCDDVPTVTYVDTLALGHDRYSIEWLGFTGTMTATPEAWAAGGTWMGVANPSYDFVQVTFYFGLLNSASLNFPYSGATSVADQGNWTSTVAGTVPEPGTLALISVALGCVALLPAWRRSS